MLIPCHERMWDKRVLLKSLRVYIHLVDNVSDGKIKSKILNKHSKELGLWCGGHFYWWKKPKCPEKTCRKSLTLSHRIHLSWAGFELTTLVVTGTDSIDSCKSNYTMITTTMAPTRIVYIEHIHGACSYFPHQTRGELEIVCLCE